MSLVDIPGGDYWPHPSSALNTSAAFSFLTIDAADERAAMIFQAPKAGYIDTLKFRVTTTTTGATVTVGLYSINTNGDPDIASGALGTTTLVVNATDDNKWLDVTLGTPVTVTEGQLLSMVVSQPSSSAGSMTLTTMGNGRDFGWGSEIPYADLYTTVWAKIGLNRPFFAVGYTSSGGIYPTWEGGPMWPGDGATPLATVSYNTGSANIEFGNIIIPNRRIRVCGMWAYMYHATTADYRMKFYRSPAGTPVEECTTPLIDGAASSNTSGGIHTLKFTTKKILEAGVKYAFTVLPGTTNSVNIYKTVANATTDMENIQGGSNMYGCYRAAGAFTEETTTRYVMGLIIDQGDDGLGTGRAILAIGV